MATLCGWASIDERGSARGGSAGDQNGREVKTGNWYDFGQKIVLRFKDRSKAKKAAQTMKTLCNGNYVGYDQNQRTTLYTEMQKVGWDASKLKTKCETDCSAMMSPVLRSAGISVSKDIYTGNMVAAIMGTGQFTKLTASKYTDSGDYLLTGDIMVNEGSHTIMALEDGAKAGGESSGSSSSGSSSSGASSGGALNKTPKWTGKVTADVLNVRTWAGEENAKLTSYPQIKNGAEVGVCAEVKDGDGDIWYYIQINGSKGQKYGFVHSAYIAKTSGGSAASSGGSHEKGDTVQFTGSRHYVSSDDTGAGSKATPCTAKITNKKDGARHPYHLQGSGVYGWVNASDIK